MMNDLIIYRILNTKTGKSYIGQSTQGLKQRRAEHLARCAGSDRHHKLYMSMRKHGVESFEFSVLCHALREEDLSALEVRMVTEYDSYRCGYNMNEGGNGVSAETREKIRAAHTGRDAPCIHKGWVTRKANGNGSTRGKVPSGEASSMAKSYIVQNPVGRLFAVTGLNAFCKENRLDHKTMLDTLKGVQTHHKGFVVLRRLEDGKSLRHAS